MIDKSDNTLLVKSETVDTLKYPIRLTKVGDLPENVEIASIKLDPKDVKVSGAKTYLDSIEYVSVKIDQSNIEKDINYDLPINLNLRDDSVKGYLTKSSERCKVIIDVLLKKDVTVKPIVTNIPDGLKVKKISLSKDFVKIKGQDDIVKSITSVDTNSIDLSNASEGENSVDVTLNLPKGVNLEDGSTGKITAKVVLEK